jgi:energy-coupling factor transporter ATP-binding protein EcfA2
VRIRHLSLRDFCGYQSADFEFGDFACLHGPNGIGKTTVLNAISLLASSLDFSGDVGGDTPPDADGWSPRVTAAQRLKSYLSKNVRFAGETGGATSFLAEAMFEHDSKEYVVVLTEEGFKRNDIVGQPWWWTGITYFAKFDSDLVNFQLRHDLWDKFARSYEGITGIRIEPEVMVDTDLQDLGEDGRIVTGFFLYKGGLRFHSRKASAGEKKIAKTLSQVVNLEPSRMPHIVLVDNLEMHAHHKRHLRVFDEFKSLFGGVQVVATTHSTIVIEQYQPREHLIDVEAVVAAART